MPYPTQNLQHVAEALARFIEQYKELTKFEGLLGSYTQQLQELENAIWEVIEGFLLPNAIGAQLDVLGRLVGEARQGRTDDRFRLAIAVRIRINRSSGTQVDLLTVARLLVGDAFPSPITYQESHPAKVVLTFPAYLSDDERAELVKALRQTKGAGIKLFLSEVDGQANAFLFNHEGESSVAANGFSTREQLLCLGALNGQVNVTAPPEHTVLDASSALAASAYVGLIEPGTIDEHSYAFDTTPDVVVFNHFRIASPVNLSVIEPLAYGTTYPNPVNFTSWGQFPSDAEKLFVAIMGRSDGVNPFRLFATAGPFTLSPDISLVGYQLSQDSGGLAVQACLYEIVSTHIPNGEPGNISVFNPTDATVCQAYAMVIAGDQKVQQIDFTSVAPAAATEPVTLADPGLLVNGGILSHAIKV